MLAIYILGLVLSAGICFLMLRDHFEQGEDICLDDVLLAALMVIFSWIGVMVFVFAFDKHGNETAIRGFTKKDNNQ